MCKLLSLFKGYIKFLIFYFINIFVFPVKKIEDKTLLLIRLDAIGDYVLFRNFVKFLKESDKFKDYRITLLGNIIWKELAEKLDKKHIDNFIWLDRIQFSKNPYYRWKKLREVASKSYEILINPRYSREFFFDDMIVKSINAKEKIGNIGDMSNMKVWQKMIGDRFYTKLLPAKSEIMFEFYRNKEFLENLLNRKINIDKTDICLYSDFNILLPKNFILLFLGASSNKRKWSIKNFTKVANYLKDKYHFEIVLGGGQSEIADGVIFEKMLNKKVYNFIGKISLVELAFIISKSKFIVSNETSAVHLAVALNTTVFVIYNGNHFGRFIPYPKELANKYYPIYHPEIEKNLDRYKEISNKYGFGSNLDINEISADKVISKIDEVICPPTIKNSQER